jgi:hypothetical protein
MPSTSSSKRRPNCPRTTGLAIAEPDPSWVTPGTSATDAASPLPRVRASAAPASVVVARMSGGGGAVSSSTTTSTGRGVSSSSSERTPRSSTVTSTGR